jgi:hypothetical protein
LNYIRRKELHNHLSFQSKQCCVICWDDTNRKWTGIWAVSQQTMTGGRRDLDLRSHIRCVPYAFAKQSRGALKPMLPAFPTRRSSGGESCLRAGEGAYGPGEKSAAKNGFATRVCEKSCGTCPRSRRFSLGLIIRT